MNINTIYMVLNRIKRHGRKLRIAGRLEEINAARGVIDRKENAQNGQKV